MMADEHICLFCNADGGNLKKSERLQSIRDASNQRQDNLHLSIQENTSFIWCHSNCLSTYCSKHHISRYLKRSSGADSDSLTSANLAKRPRRQDTSFVFTEHCLFCGLVCVIERDTRNPNRWREAYLCRTADRPGTVSFKSAILRRCQERCDDWGEAVSLRVSGAVTDLHAADGRYHKDCHAHFFTNKPTSSDSFVSDGPLATLVAEMEASRSTIWNSCSCFKRYEDLGGKKLNRRNLVKMLANSVQGLIVLSSPGEASILTFRSHAAVMLNMVADDENDNIAAAISVVATSIRNECLSMSVDEAHYKTKISIDSVFMDCSKTLRQLLRQIDDKLDNTTSSCMIGSIVTSKVKSVPTPLQVALSVALNQSKSLVNLFNDFGVTCTYSELRRFRTSAAVATSNKHASRGLVGQAEHGLVQVVADNFDANVCTQNGLRTTHGLAMIVTQKHQDGSHGCYNEDVITRLKWEEVAKVKSPDITVERCTGSKKPPMPLSIAKQLEVTKLPSLQCLAFKAVANLTKIKHAADDLQFFRDVLNGGPEFGGWNTRTARQRGQKSQPKTRVAYVPLLDMVPSEPDTIKTALMEAKKISNSSGQEWTVFTNDQQLYRVAVHLTWTEPELQDNILLRLGGMHMLMSFIGCIGTLMAGSGLEDILGCAFAGVSNMLSGHKYPQNVRAMRMLAEEILRPLVTDAAMSNMIEVVALLDDKATASRTTKMWVDCFLKPVFIIMTFIRAEREGDWVTHLQACSEMMPYFFAAGHVNYSRFGLYYLRSMQRLPTELFKHFMNGEHVVRHSEGIWNAIPTDQFIETTYMRYGHAPGGIIGFTLQPRTLHVWALSLHIFGSLLKDLDDMRDTQSQHSVTSHKEEARSRIRSDCVDRLKLQNRLAMCIDPLDFRSHPGDGIINIVTGEIVTDKSLNVDSAVDIGITQCEQFQQSWPDGFQKTISKKVKSLAVVTKSVKLGHLSGQVVVVDNTLIYARTMGLLSSSRKIEMLDVLEYELAPVPTSLFDDEGKMRQTSKSVLKGKLRVNVSSRLCRSTSVVIVDACAMLWCVPWPAQPATVDHYVKNFMGMVKNKLTKCTTLHIVFDRYFQKSIKCSTRQKRQCVSRHHQLTLSTPLPARNVILNSSHNKAQVIKLIIDALEMIPKDDSKRLIVTGQNPTPLEVGVGPWGLETTHEEADVNMVYIAVHEAKSDPTTPIRVISDDTDVLLILSYHTHDLKISNEITMEECSGQRSVISINNVVDKHAAYIRHVLAGHALTGCDSTSALAGIGKARFFKVLQSFKGSLEAVGTVDAENDVVFRQCDAFIAQLYGNNETTTTKLRGRLWGRKMASKSITSAPKLSKLPPTTAALRQHIMRAHLQTAYWKAAARNLAPSMDPINFGWENAASTDALLKPTMLPSGTLLAPEAVLHLISCGCSTGCAGLCGCLKVGLTCTHFCKCNAECNNKNKHTETVYDSGEDVSNSDSDDTDCDK